MERLNVGKTLDEGRHCLGIIADLEIHIQSHDLDPGDDGAWAHHGARLRFKCNAPHQDHIFILA
jgi:hypothetical protein